MKKRFLSALPMLASCILIPTAACVAVAVFKGNRAAVIVCCIVAVLLACVPFVIRFEKSSANAGYPVIIAVMTAMSVAGRVIFAPIPSFKPVTAIVVITAIHFGTDAGFMTGALSAAVSNFFFGQGPWTPFQMFSWGLIGLLAGLSSRLLKRNKLLLAVFGAFSGVLYSLSMDIFTVLWADGGFNLSRYTAAIVTAAPITVIYAVSNIIFLAVLSEPLGKMLNRVIQKYRFDIGT